MTLSEFLLQKNRFLPEDMEIIKDYPPNIKQIKEVFPILPESMIFCWGDIIYNPSGQDLADHIKIHEVVHSDQQQNKPEEWWNEYLNDKDFRLKQELLAYQRQYQFAKIYLKDRNELARFLWKLAQDLSSLYKVNIDFENALKQIKE